MSRPPRDITEWMRYMERELIKARRNGQANIARQITAEIIKVREDMPDAADTRTPAAPIEFTTQTSVLSDPRPYSQLSMGFSDVTVATDATAITVAYYELWGRDETGWNGTGTAPIYRLIETSAESEFFSEPYVPGSTWRFRVRAIGEGMILPGNWSAEQVVTMVADTVAPKIPPNPDLSQNLGVIIVKWDGLAADDSAMDPDFRFLEIAVAVGTPGEADIIPDTFIEAGQIHILDLPYNEPRQFRMRAVDWSGNRSAWSGTSSITRQPLVSADISGLDATLQAQNESVEAAEASALQAAADAQAAQTAAANSATQATNAQTAADTAASEAAASASTAQAAQDAADAAAARAAEAARNAQSTISNGGAEFDLADWVEVTPGVTVDATVANSGTKSFTSTGTGDIVQAETPVVEGDTWRLGGWYITGAGFDPASDAGFRIQSTTDGTTWTDAAAIPLTDTQVWTHAEAEYLVPAGVTHIRPRLEFNYAGGVQAWTDDITLANVTEAKALLAQAEDAQAAATASASEAAASATAANNAQADAEAAQQAATTAQQNAAASEAAAEQAAIDAGSSSAAALAAEENAEAAQVKADEALAGLAQKSDIDWIIARGTDLVTNGTGLLGDDTNFTSFTFNPDAPTGAAGSFDATGAMNVFNDEDIPVDTSRRYLIRMMVKQRNSDVPSSRFYAGLSPRDKQANVIYPHHYWYHPNTHTTLTTDLNPGDTVINVASTANWNIATAAETVRYAGIWNWTDPAGRVWPEKTYTRNVPIYTALTATTLTLKVAYTGPAMPAGTPISNTKAGGNYMYIPASNLIAPLTWTQFSGTVGGAHDSSTGAATTAFPPGTAFVRLVFLCNYNTSIIPAGEVSTQSFASISFSDATQALKEVEQAQADADQALLDAAAAHAAAGDAETIANDALNAATHNAKNLFSVDPPAGTAPQGSIWFQTDVNGTVIGQWQQTGGDADTDGSTWTKRDIKSEVIANIDVGKLTGGFIDVVHIETRNLTVGAGTLGGTIDTLDSWRNASDTTFIDGGKIYTGSVKALQIDVNNLAADTAFVGSMRTNILTADSVNATAIAAGAITSKHTITGATFQTTATASRGVKFDSSGINAWDPTGALTFQVDAATGYARVSGRYYSGAPGTGGVGIIPAVDAYNLKQVAILFSANGSYGNTNAGMWVDDTAGSQVLNLRGHNGGDVEIKSQNLQMNQASGRIGNFSNWALGDVGNGSNYLPNLSINPPSGTGYFRITNAPTVSASANLVIATTPAGVLYKSTSSVRYKADVQSWTPDYAVLGIQPRSWVDRNPADKADPMKRYYGAIAEEVITVLPELVTLTEFDEPDAIQYDRLAVALIPVLRDIVARVEALEGT